MNQEQEIITESLPVLKGQISKCESFGNQLCDCGYCCADG
jgi:hypothetical protein